MLITLLVAVLVAAIIYWIVTLIPFPPGPFKNIVLAILGLIFIVWLLQTTGVFGDLGWHRGRL
jgi:nitrate reductase NapE component